MFTAVSLPSRYEAALQDSHDQTGPSKALGESRMSQRTMDTQDKDHQLTNIVLREYV